MESIVLKSVRDSLQKLSGDNQFAYKERTSTLHAQIAVHDFITKELDSVDSRGAVVLSFDLRRAFDTLSHRAIIDTLVEGGLPSNFIHWLVSYLRDRCYRISLQDIVFSTYRNMSSGVPQGSILSPLIFAAHMGSLKLRTRGGLMVKYADDVLVVIPVRSDTDVDYTIANAEGNID